MHAIRPKEYGEVRGEIRDGDVLLWKPTTLAGRLICWGTGQPYSHASMAAWDPAGRLRNVEMIQWRGGCYEPLSQHVERYPGRCEVWRPKRPLYNGQAAVVAMLWLLGRPYGWMDLLHIAAEKVMGIHHCRLDSDSPDTLRFCSESIAYSLRVGAKIIACPGKADSQVSPGDLAASGFADYQFTLFP